jgi:hypothetical protein
MSLKLKKKIYLSLDKEVLQFVDEQSEKLKLSRAKYIHKLLSKEHDLYKKKMIDKIIEGI